MTYIESFDENGDPIYTAKDYGETITARRRSDLQILLWQAKKRADQRREILRQQKRRV